MKIIKDMWSLLNAKQKVVTVAIMLTLEMWLLICPWEVL